MKKLTFSPKQFVREQYHRLHQIRDAPHAVAGGVAIGMFWGFTPLTGLKTLLSMLLAWFFRCSKLSAVIAVALHDVLTPIWPVVLLWEYKLGFWLLSNPHHLPQRLSVKKMGLHELLHLRTLELLWPTFVGSLLFGIPAALLSYWIVERSLERYEHTHHKHLTPPA